MPKPKLNFQDLFDQVWYVIKTRENNYVTDHTSAINAEIGSELSWLII